MTICWYVTDEEEESGSAEDSPGLKFQQFNRRKGELIKKALLENAVLRSRLLEVLIEMKSYETS